MCKSDLGGRSYFANVARALATCIAVLDEADRACRRNRDLVGKRAQCGNHKRHGPGVSGTDGIGAGERQAGVNPSGGVGVHQAVGNVSGTVRSKTTCLKDAVAVLESGQREDIVSVEPAGWSGNGQGQGRARGGSRRLRVASLHGKGLGFLRGRRASDSAIGSKRQACRQRTRGDGPRVGRDTSAGDQGPGVRNSNGAVGKRCSRNGKRLIDGDRLGSSVHRLYGGLDIRDLNLERGAADNSGCTTDDTAST